METRVFHGEISPATLARALVARFNRGSWVAQQVGRGPEVVVQIRTRRRPTAGGRTALTISLQSVEDGVAVKLGRQAWLGVAASLGSTALTALKSPFHLIGRLDDLAQDIENLQLSREIWETIEETARLKRAGHLISERLRRLSCSYCRSANAVGESNCIACGAPLGEDHPRGCPHCGYVVPGGTTTCPNCRKPLSAVS